MNEYNLHFFVLAQGTKSVPLVNVHFLKHTELNYFFLPIIQLNRQKCMLSAQLGDYQENLPMSQADNQKSRQNPQIFK